jgi:hypothetical protein
MECRRAAAPERVLQPSVPGELAEQHAVGGTCEPGELGAVHTEEPIARRPVTVGVGGRPLMFSEATLIRVIVPFTWPEAQSGIYRLPLLSEQGGLAAAGENPARATDRDLPGPRGRVAVRSCLLALAHDPVPRRSQLAAARPGHGAEPRAGPLRPRRRQQGRLSSARRGTSASRRRWRGCRGGFCPCRRSSRRADCPQSLPFPRTDRPDSPPPPSPRPGRAAIRRLRAPTGKVTPAGARNGRNHPRPAPVPAPPRQRGYRPTFARRQHGPALATSSKTSRARRGQRRRGSGVRCRPPCPRRRAWPGSAVACGIQGGHRAVLCGGGWAFRRGSRRFPGAGPVSSGRCAAGLPLAG